MGIEKKLRIDFAAFHGALNRDVDANDEPTHSAFLDLVTGRILRVYACDKDARREGITERENRDNGMQLALYPERYVNIPGRTYAGELEILRQFLESDWTCDAAQKRLAKAAYGGSITAWMKHFGYRGPVKAYFSFRERMLEQLGDELLAMRGIEAEWTGRPVVVQ